MATTDTRVTDINARLTSLGASVTSSSSSSGGAIGITPLKIVNPTPISNPSMLHQAVELLSYDNTIPSDKVLLSESFEITFGNISPIKLAGIGGDVRYFQFGTSNYGVKFHLPYGTNLNKMYITYCVKDSNYAGGHKDYVTSLEQAWIDAALAYCKKVPTNTDPTSVSVTRSFTTTQFPTYLTKTWFFYYKGTGASSGVNNQGAFNVSLAFVEREISTEANAFLRTI
jgi:hypothetical protein